MTSKDTKPALPVPWPCPAWCAGDIRSDDPDEGVVYSSGAKTLMVTGDSERPGSQPLAVLIETWVPHLAARPPAGLITWSLDGAWGPHLTPAETKEFIRILSGLASTAEAA